MDRRSSGSLRRTGRYTTCSARGAAAAAVTAAFYSPFPDPAPELNGCTRFELSR